MEITEFVRELQKAAAEADTRRASVLVEMFEHERPKDYQRLRSVSKLRPEEAIERLKFYYPVLINLLKLLPNHSTIVEFTQRAILLNENHKEQRRLKE